MMLFACAAAKPSATAIPTSTARRHATGDRASRARNVSPSSNSVTAYDIFSHALRVGGQTLRQDLERYVAVEACVPRAIDFAHATRAQQRTARQWYGPFVGAIGRNDKC